MDQGAVRDLDQIQEEDEETRTPRALTFALVGIGGACIAFAVLAIGGRKTSSTEKRPDPLGELVASHNKTGATGGAAVGSPAVGGAAGGAGALTGSAPSAATVTQLSAKDVTFPSILSDDARPTTALAAVRSGNSPPPPTDKLPVVRFAGGTPAVPHDDSWKSPAGGDDSASSRNSAPRSEDQGSSRTARSTEVALAPPAAPSLPAQNVLEASPIVTRPRDAMTKTASDSAQINSAPAASVPAGHEGGWQLQVSSFKTEAEAEQFADQLRARGHKAYTVEARVVGRGTWWRVRVGPFPTQHLAQAYRAQFEAKEHVVPFVVQPEKAADKADKADKH